MEEMENLRNKKEGELKIKKEMKEEGNYDQTMKSEQRDASEKKKLGEVWVAVKGLTESPTQFEP